MTGAAGPVHECEYTGKQCHPDRKSAEAHRDGLRRRGRARNPDRLNVYRCGDHWHVGNRETTEFERKVRRAMGGIRRYP